MTLESENEALREALKALVRELEIATYKNDMDGGWRFSSWCSRRVVRSSTFNLAKSLVDSSPPVRLHDPHAADPARKQSQENEKEDGAQPP